MIKPQPISVPVWFDWDGVTVQMFASADSPKMRRLQSDPRVSLLVSNDVDEPESWVAFDGSVTIDDSGGFELAESLAKRYWDLLQGEGILKTLFKVIKASASEGQISRVFITGVSPVVLSDMTSGYNVATSIYLYPELNNICGINTRLKD